MRKQGFMLIELLVYSTVLVVLAGAVMAYAARCHLDAVKYAHTCTAYAHMCATWDVLMRDLHQAPSKKLLWKVCTDTVHIWATTSGDVGWENSPKGLVRSEGTYNTARQKWNVREQSLVSATLRYALVPADENEQWLHAITAKLELPNGEKVSCVIALQAGVAV